MDKRTVKAKLSNIAQSPQKLRLVATVVRGMDVTKALDTLKFLNRKGNLQIVKLIESAVANALDRYNLDKEDLMISEIRVDEAVTRKTGRFASRGRFSKILKRRSHLSLELREK